MLECFLKQIEHLLSNGITPIYFFDGKPSEEKMKLIEKRNETHNKALDKINLLKKELDGMQSSSKMIPISLLEKNQLMEVHLP